jgi:DNA-binding LacI/PurR family transcriptional regulator
VGVTIADIAAAASVSKSTVSRAFARPGSVNDDTRRRIFAVASQLGYSPPGPSPASRPASSGQIGLFIPDIANPFYPPLIKAVQIAGRRLGLSLVIIGGDDDPHTDDQEIHRVAPDVDGMLILGPRLTADQLRAVNEITPVVLINHEADGIPTVAMWSTEAVYQAIRHLAALGHRQLAYLAVRDDNHTNRFRQRAVLAAAAELGCDVTVIGPGEPSFLAGVQAGDLVLATPVTAVVAFNGLIAFGCLHRLTDRGVEVGKQISLVSLDDTWITSAARPSLTSIQTPYEATGTIAVRVLHELVMTGSSPAGTTFLPAELIVRSSTGPAPAGGSPALRTAANT